uniref:G_PROTEIN_RECEP_F1_2 domain-containing protein n=1 Tax=Mesocestoides corti TaxID=53468 RepID=A0A5K3EVB3_MESCO
MNSSESLGSSDHTVFMALVPVLVQCFGLIILGFVAGQFKLLTGAQVKGLGVYVTTFALPAIFFTVMVTIDFSDVDWNVVLAVSLGKLAIFLFSMGIVLVISRGRSIGLAGILAIFTSQSNDVALAYPVLRLLYPDLASYIYLFAPAQLVILNPFAYFALEWHRTQEKAAVHSVMALDDQPSHHITPKFPFKRILKVFRHVISNPLFFMTAIGVFFNFLLKHKLPSIVEGFFKDLGASFSATALFYLGFSMVGKLSAIDRRGVYTLVFILIGKVLISPFITREIAVLLLAHQPLNSSVPKSSFAFLYAAAPTAPPVFLFSAKFGIIPEVIGAGLVIGTFLYAPIMFIFAGMATLVNVDPGLYDNTLERAAICLSWASLLCCTWTLTILIVTKKAQKMPYRVLVCLMVSVLTFCFSVAIGSIWEPWTWDPKVGATWSQYIKFMTFFLACTGARVWTAFLGIALVFQVKRRRPPSNRAQSAFAALGVILPIAVTATLMLTSHNTSVRDVNPAFHYGRTQVDNNVSTYANIFNGGSLYLFVNLVNIFPVHLPVSKQPFTQSHCQRGRRG